MLPLKLRPSSQSPVDIYAGAPIASRVSFFFPFIYLEMSLFRVFFVPLPRSLRMESTSYVLSFRIVFFYLVTTDWIFDISLLCENSTNQSIKYCGFTKNLTSSGLSEHSPEKYVKTFRWDHRLQRQVKPLHGIQLGSPMVVTLGQQDNVGEKPTVILYIYINHHAGTPNKSRAKGTMSLDYKSIWNIGSRIGWVSMQESTNKVVM